MQGKLLATVVGAICTILGITIGVMSRKKAFNKLKEQIRLLQSDQKKVIDIIKELKRQIEELKIRYNLLIVDDLINKQNSEEIKDTVFLACCYVEYIFLIKKKLNNIELSDAERNYYEIFESIQNNNNEEYLESKQNEVYKHIYNKYNEYIDNNNFPQIR